LGFYVWNSLKEFIVEINTENNTKFTFPGFKICPKNLGNDSSLNISNISLYMLYGKYSDEGESVLDLFIPNDYSFNDEKNFEKDLTNFRPYNFNIDSLNMTDGLIPKNTYFFNDTIRCRNFIPSDTNDSNNVKYVYAQKNESLANELLFIITSDNLSIYDFFEINFGPVFITFNNNTENRKIFFNQFFITPGQYVIYLFDIRIRKYYSSSLPGFLGFGTDEDEIIIDIQEKVLGQVPNASNTTVFQLRPYSDYIIYDEVKYNNDVVKVISNFGGFYGAISGVFVLLFGASKLEPWGVCQKYFCYPYRQSFEKNLAKRYVSRGGIPLAEDLPPNAEIKDRVAVLENLLKEYYIDDYYLVKLRETREKLEKLKDKPKSTDDLENGTSSKIE
ncbi:unnamed protein product, partial [Rhizophagus irregularis]